MSLARLLLPGAILLIGIFASETIVADEPEAQRPPLPESLLTESATDVDAEEAGELEWEANLASVGAKHGGAHAMSSSVEVEWRVLRPIGLRLEPSYVREVGARSAHDTFGFSAAAAFGLVHDFERDVHLQLEILGRTPDGSNERVFEPGETVLPAAADLVGAVRRGPLTLRATIGAEAGGSFAHAPMHTDLALLTGFGTDTRFGFVAMEVRSDWAREAPVVLAPEVVADTTPLGLPFRLGIALPVNMGAAASAPSFGLMLRLILLTGREIEYGLRGGE